MQNTIENTLTQKQEKVFDEILELVFESEGGKSNHKNDYGGKTNRGITQRTYDDKSDKYGHPKKDVDKLTLEESKTFYRKMYIESNAHELNDPQLAYVYFDTVVNSGVGGGATKLQQAIIQERFDLKQDGICGMNTVKMANQIMPQKLSQNLIDIRRVDYQNKAESDQTQKCFLKGWNNRLDTIKRHVGEQKISKQIMSQQFNSSFKMSQQGMVQNPYSFQMKLFGFYG